MRTQLICCSYLSAAGVLFLSILGVVLYYQSNYIRGINESIPPERLATNCWFGAGVYAGTWLFSIIATGYQNRRDALKKIDENEKPRGTVTSWDDLESPTLHMGQVDVGQLRFIDET